MASNPEIQGIQQFDRALNEIQSKLPSKTKEAAQQVAKEWIAAARNKATRPKAREAAQALTVGNDEAGATLVNDHPSFFGEEFGGQARPSTMQFPPHQGQRGYWLFPAARENQDNFTRIWERAIDDATQAWNHRE